MWFSWEYRFWNVGDGKRNRVAERVRRRRQRATTAAGEPADSLQSSRSGQMHALLSVAPAVRGGRKLGEVLGTIVLECVVQEI